MVYEKFDFGLKVRRVSRLLKQMTDMKVDKHFIDENLDEFIKIYFEFNPQSLKREKQHRNRWFNTVGREINTNEKGKIAEQTIYYLQEIIRLRHVKQEDYIKELQVKLAQSENHNRTLMETQHLKLDEELRKYKVKISQLEKENEELKSNVDSNSPNNTALIKNLQNANTALKEQLEKAKEEHLHFNTIWKTEGITEQDIIDMKRQISHQCDLIKKLKEEISLSPYNEVAISQLQDEIKSLQDEIKQLKNENMLLAVRCGEYDELCQEWKMQSNDIAKLMNTYCDTWSNSPGDTLSDVKELIDNKNCLEDDLKTIYDDAKHDAENMKELHDENVILKQEHKELTEKQEQYRKLITQLVCIK